METSSGQETSMEQLTERAFSHRNTVKGESVRNLLVEIPDEDGYAGWTENLHGLGIVETGGELIIEADYNDRRRANRRQDVIRVDQSTKQAHYTCYIDGQASLLDTLETTDEIANKLATRYLREAVYGVRQGFLNADPYSFLSPELQAITRGETEK